MRTPEEVTLVLKEASENYAAFVHKPTDADITAMAETLTPILMEIDYDPVGGTHNLWGVIAPANDYIKQYNCSFAIPPRQRLYDDGIAKDATTSEVRKAEAEHTAKQTDRALYDAANKGCIQFLTGAVEETWYRELKSPTTFYTKVTALDFFSHLRTNCGGLHETDAVTIQAGMMGFYAEAEGIPHYINMLEEAQAQADRAGLPISDDVLVATANRAMLASNDYPDETKAWNKLAPTSRTWALWKPTYHEVYTANKRVDDIRGEQGKPFGGSASNPFGGTAPAAENSTAKAVKFGAANQPTDEMVDSLAGYLDNMAAAVTNGGSTFEQYAENFTKLADSIVTLTDTNKKQQAELRALREENASLKKKLAASDAGGGRRQGSPSNTDFPGCGPKQYWVKGAYCWTHGYGVGKRHDSGNCRDKKAGHQIAATRDNTMDGCQDNKDWDK